MSLCAHADGESCSLRQGVLSMAYSQPLTKVTGRLRIRNHLARQCLAEFLGVLVLLLLTQGAVAQAVTSGENKGNFFTMFLAGSLAVIIAVYVSGNVSGAHLNPAFSLAMRLLGRFPWAKLPVYCLVQLLSAFCASGTTYAVYYDALQNYTGGSLTVTGPRETASIFATCPISVPEQWLPGSGQMDHLAAYGGPSASFNSKVLGTGILIVGTLAIVDTRNKGVPAGLEPVAGGLLVLAIGLSLGVNCGFPLNPARDLGPRLFTYMAGWGPEVFRAGNGWWRGARSAQPHTSCWWLSTTRRGQSQLRIWSLPRLGNACLGSVAAVKVLTRQPSPPLWTLRGPEIQGW
ncbi:hypothetical protein GH733_010338 [Mirounga leonina]|nr:hypothetical protein GH733_010338 [Mirounga leonina]